MAKYGIHQLGLMGLVFWIRVMFPMLAAHAQEHVNISGSNSSNNAISEPLDLMALKDATRSGSSSNSSLSGKTNKTPQQQRLITTVTPTPVTAPATTSTANTATTRSTTVVPSSTSSSTTSAPTKPPDPCYAVTCLNGGTCHHGLCLCTFAYTGDRCQTATVTAAATSTTTTSPQTTTSSPTTTKLATSIVAVTAIKVGGRPQNGTTQTNSSLSNGTKHFGKNQSNPIGNNKTDISDNRDQTDHIKIDNVDVVINITSDPCDSMPCHNGATCRLEGELLYCLCAAGYTGDRCEAAICSEEYLPAPVNGLKSCIHQPETMSDISCELTCKKGYYFKDDQLTHVYDCTDGLWLPSEKQVAGCYRIDYCLNVVCKNNGTCEELWRDAKCHCQPGFEGDKCQIDIDECKSSPCNNGGTCVDGINMFQCLCARGFAGIQCEIEILEEPVLTNVSPGYGPHAGGTLITVSGRHLIVPSQHIFMYLSDISLSGDKRDKILCEVLKSNTTHIVARTPAVQFNIIRILPLAVQFAGGVVYSSRLYYEYKPNPQVTAVEPTDTIMAGGTLLTISGKCLDSVNIPVVQVALVATWQTQIVHGQVVTNKVKAVFAEPCILGTFRNETSMICHMPKMEIPDEVSPLHTKVDETNRKRRNSLSWHRYHSNHRINISSDGNLLTNYSRNINRYRREQYHDGSKLNRTELKYYLGLKFDGEERFKNLSAVPSLQQYGTLTVYDGPVIYTRKIPIKYQDLRNGQLVINGSKLLEGVRITDYNISVGMESCVIVEIRNLIIICQPPEEEPEKDVDDNSDDPVIMVKIGTNICIRYGTIQYPSSLWIIIGPVIGVLVVLTAILIALICIRIRRTTKAQKHKGQYHYSPGEMIRLPSVRQGHCTEPLNISDSNNGSLLVFSQDPDISESHDPDMASHYDASSAVTTTDDEFDPPEEFYENKETIKRQKKHKMALDQFVGRPQKATPRYTAGPQNTNDSKRQQTNHLSKPNDTTSSHSNVDSANHNYHSPSVGKQEANHRQSEEDIYVNDDVNPSADSSLRGTDEDVYENSRVKAAGPKLNKKSKRFSPRKPASLPDVPVNKPQKAGVLPTSGTPPPVPNTPRPKLNLMREARTNNNRRDSYKHNSLGHPFEEHPYSNSKLGRSDDDDDDDDIYVNSPIKSRGLRAKAGRRSARSPGTRRRDRKGATLWF